MIYNNICYIVIDIMILPNAVLWDIFSMDIAVCFQPLTMGARDMPAADL